MAISCCPEAEVNVPVAGPRIFDWGAVIKLCTIFEASRGDASFRPLQAVLEIKDAYVNFRQPRRTQSILDGRIKCARMRFLQMGI